MCIRDSTHTHTPHHTTPHHTTSHLYLQTTHFQFLPLTDVQDAYCSCCLPECFRGFHTSEIKCKIFMNIDILFHSVSYTHLDVYKRQIIVVVVIYSNYAFE